MKRRVVAVAGAVIASFMFVCAALLHMTSSQTLQAQLSSCTTATYLFPEDIDTCTSDAQMGYLHQQWLI
ncbi:MAG: hypothetical protein ACRD3W_30700, partial [Terriglobales bacterium]